MVERDEDSARCVLHKCIERERTTRPATQYSMQCAALLFRTKWSETVGGTAPKRRSILSLICPTSHLLELKCTVPRGTVTTLPTYSRTRGYLVCCCFWSQKKVTRVRSSARDNSKMERACANPGSSSPMWSSFIPVAYHCDNVASHWHDNVASLAGIFHSRPLSVRPAIDLGGSARPPAGLLPAASHTDIRMHRRRRRRSS